MESIHKYANSKNNKYTMILGKSQKIPQPKRRFTNDNPILTNLTAQWDEIEKTPNNLNEYYKYRDTQDYLLIFSILGIYKRKLRFYR